MAVDFFKLKVEINIDGKIHTLEITDILDGRVVGFKFDDEAFVQQKILAIIPIEVPGNANEKVFDSKGKVGRPEVSDTIIEKIDYLKLEKKDTKEIIEAIKKEHGTKLHRNTISKIINRNKDLPEGMKRCSRCRKIKPLNDFNKSNYSSSGVQTNCRECNKESLIDWRKSKSESVKKNVKEYNDNMIFLNWLNDSHKTNFDIMEFRMAHPELSTEQFNSIISHNVEQKKITQISDTKFVVTEELKNKNV